jgi:tRNA-guanine family transglycosylase
MDFYVSWYPGDPDYPQYDSDCSLLISITSVAHDWTIKQLATVPRRLLIDSGGYRFAIAPREALSPKQVLNRQLDLLSGAEIPVVICASDCPVLDPAASSNTRDQHISQTIAFAYEFKNLIVQKGLPSHVTPMAIIQGYDTDSFGFCAHELKLIGFPLYGIGSLAVLRQHAPIMQRVGAVTEVVDAPQLHIFGVSGVETARALSDLGVHSIDSARPAKAAAYNEILYSQPFRRFGIWETAFEHDPIKGRIPISRRLLAPLPCDCPACAQDAGGIMGVGQRASIRDRALHNYYHLKRTFCSDGD